MNEKRLLLLVAVLVVGLIGVIGVQAYHLHGLHTQVQQLKLAESTPAISVSSPSPISRQSGNLPLQAPSSNPILPDDFWSSSGFGSDDWNPFEEIQRMQAHMDRKFNSTLNQFQASPNFGAIALDSFFLPELDLQEEEDRYVATLDLPGLDQSRVDIQVEGQTLSITGQRDETVTDEDNQGRMIRRERSVGNFERRVSLPGPVNQEGVEAHYDNGVLTISLPKAERESNIRKVPLQSNDTNPPS